MRRRALAMIITIALIFTAAFASTAVCFAAESNPSVTIVNPVNNSSAYAGNLLVSVKITTAAAISVTVYQRQSSGKAITVEDWEKAVKEKGAAKAAASFSEKAVMTAEKFEATGDLSFYTKKLEKTEPGVYVVRVNTLDDEGKAIKTNESTVLIKAKAADAASEKVFESQSAGAAQFLQNLLKNIFGS